MITHDTLPKVERFLSPAVESGIISKSEFDAIQTALQPKAKRAISLNAFCGRLEISRQTAWRWVKSGKIPALKLGRSVRIPETVIDEILAGKLGV